MAKRVDTSGLDADFVINQAKPSNRNKELKPYDPSAPVQAQEEVPQEQMTEPEAVKEELPELIGDTAPRESSRRKRGQQSAGFKETFLKRNEIKTRQCVYISYRVHSLIAKLVRTLADAGNDISVGGYIDTVLEEHLNRNKDEINELYRQQRGDLI